MILMLLELKTSYSDSRSKGMEKPCVGVAVEWLSLLSVATPVVAVWSVQQNVGHSLKLTKPKQLTCKWFARFLTYFHSFVELVQRFCEVVLFPHSIRFQPKSSRFTFRFEPFIQQTAENDVHSEAMKTIFLQWSVDLGMTTTAFLHTIVFYAPFAIGMTTF